MKKYLRKILIGLFSFGLLFSLSRPFEIGAVDFEAEEDYYYELCSKPVSSSEEKAVCKEFQTYLSDKANDIFGDLADLNTDINEIQKDLDKYLDEASKYSQQIDTIQSEVNKINKSIEDVNLNITTLENRIIIRQDNIDTLNLAITTRMASMQGVSNLNGYIDFIFGAENFGDFIRRVEGIKDITEYDNEQIRKLEEEVKALNEDKDSLLSQKTFLEAQRKTLSTNMDSLNILKAEVDKIVVEYRKKEGELEEQRSSIAGDLDEIKDSLNDVSDALGTVAPSPGWIYPVKGNFRVSETVWFYSSGGYHIGVDLAIPMGSKLVAPANGVIVFVSDRCSSDGYFCSSCGWPGLSGGGNQVAMIMQIGEDVYYALNMHLKKGVSDIVSVGDIVNQGDLIGYVGDSGCSTGPHLHHELIYLGKNNFTEMVNKFKNSGDLSMGTGRGGTAYSKRCEVKSAPCKANPNTIYNIKRNGRYTG